MAACKVCSEVVICSASDTVQCSGACNANFHVRCAGLSVFSKAAVKMLNESPNLSWFCCDCMSFKVKDVARSLAEIKQSMNKVIETVESTKVAVASCGPPYSPAISGPSFNCAGTVSSLKRRRVGHGSVEQSIARSPAPLQLQITGSRTDDAIKIKAVESRKLIVVSQLHPTTTAGEMSEYLNAHLKVENTIRANLLLPRGRSLEELDYVSVKLSVPESLYDLLMAPEVWPKGVTVREFISRPRILGQPLGSFLPPKTLVTNGLNTGPTTTEMEAD